MKLDKGKIPVWSGFLARFPRAIYAVAQVSHLGCVKYDLPPGDINFLDVPDGYRRYSEADARHMLDEALYGSTSVEHGGKLPEGGMEVIRQAQHAWNALARLEILLSGKGGPIDLATSLHLVG